MAGLRQCVECAQHLLPDMYYEGRVACKKCVIAKANAWRRAHPERTKETAKRWRDAPENKKRSENARLKYRYGVTLEEKLRLMEAQEDRCAICRLEFESKPHLDHCHRSGAIRGVLCDTCNRGIGYFKDQPEMLESAANYLRAFT